MSNGKNYGRNGSGHSPENDYGVPLEQIIHMGEQAAQLLNSPVYNLSHRMALDQTIQEWAATQPKEREKRESLWFELQALGRVAQTMAGMVERAQQAAQARNEEQENADRYYLDRQGFGLYEQFGAGQYN